MQHDLLAVFVVVLLSTLGMPIPAAPVLLLAGAQAAGQTIYGVEALGVATTASLVSAVLWFVAGRRLGRRVLALLCRVSISPDTCVRKNELSFENHGAITLVIAKFVPGLSILAPPLAGALGMRAAPFVLFSTVGAALWAGSGIALGLIFHAQINRVVDRLGAASAGATLAVVVAALALYLGWRLWTRHRDRQQLALFEGIEPDELSSLMQDGPAPVVVDVRSRAPRGARAATIPGAIHLDLAGIQKAPLDAWPSGAMVVTYCDCPNDASAVKAAQILTRRGWSARVLVGGIDAWVESRHPVEPALAG